MKNILLNLFLMVPIFFTESCVTESERIDRQYQILNISEVNVRIKFYNTFKNVFFEIDLVKNGTYLGDKLTYMSDSPQLNYQNSSFPTRAFKDSDSIIIIFNNEKYLSMKYDSTIPGFNPLNPTVDSYIPVQRNLTRQGNYKQIRKEVFQYSITQQDHESATPCNGNCD